MIANRRRQVLRRTPVDVLLSPLTPIGDIASGGMSESTGTTETLTWETASDWDNAADVYGTVHESTYDHQGDDIITLGLSYDSFPVAPSNLEIYYPLDEDSGSTINDISGNNRDASETGDPTPNETGTAGTTSWLFDGSGDGFDTGYNYNTGQDTTLCAWVSVDDFGPGSFDTGRVWSDQRHDLATNPSGEFQFRWGNASYSATGYSTNTWYFLTLRWDNSATEVEGFVDASSVGTDVNGQSDETNNFWLGYNPNNDTPFAGNIDGAGFWSTYLSTSQIQELYDSRTDGYLETATKVFSGSSKPDLQNLSYSLNSQTIDLKVIGSPGTANEETVTQTLDGSTSYSLTWSNSHTDFRIRPNLKSSDVTATPTFSRGELVATV